MLKNSMASEKVFMLTVIDVIRNYMYILVKANEENECIIWI